MTKEKSNDSPQPDDSDLGTLFGNLLAVGVAILVDLLTTSRK
jgi:hypothetical protein